MEDQSAPIPEEITSELGGIIYMDDGRSMREVGRVGVSLGQEAVDRAAKNDYDSFDFW